MSRRGVIGGLFFLLAGALWVALSLSAYGVLCTPLAAHTGNPHVWVGSLAKWSNSSNWLPTGVPGRDDPLVFPASGAVGASTNDLCTGAEFASIEFDGTGYTVGGNRIQLGTSSASGTITATIGLNIMSLPVQLANSVSVIIGTGNSANPTLAISGVVSGDSGTLTESGLGVLTLSASNLYFGPTVVAGKLSITNPAALGNTGSGTTVVGGGTLKLSNVQLVVEPITLNGTSSSNAVLLAATASNLLGSSGSVQLLGTKGTITVPASDTLTVRAPVTGSSVTKSGPGTLVMAGHNSYTGSTTVSDGVLKATTDDALGSAGATVSVALAKTLALDGPITIPQAITLAGAATNGTLEATSATPTVTGGITLSSAHTNIGADSGAGLIISSTIGGASGGLTKVGPGIVRLGGSTANGYGGATLVKDGILQLGKPAGTIAVAGTVTVGDNTSPSPDVLQLLADGQLATAPGVTVLKTGLLDLHGHQQTLTTLTLQAGDVDTGSAGLLTLGSGGVVVQTTTGTSTIQGHVDLGGAARNFDIKGSFTLSVPATISGVGAGSAGITEKNSAGTGTGTLILAGDNTYDGPTTVLKGILVAGSNHALGATSGTTTVSLGAALQLSAPGGISVPEPITLNCTGSGCGVLPAQLENKVGVNTLLGPITLSGGLSVGPSIGVDSGSSLLMSGVLGGGGFTKRGPGMLTLAGANTYSGTTNVLAGLVDVTNAQGLGTISGQTVVLSGGAVGVDGTFALPEQLTVNGSGVSNGGAVEGRSGNPTIAAPIAMATASSIGVDASASVMTVTATISGTGPLTKVGPGTLALAPPGTETYTNGTTVSNGVLQDAGSSGGAIPNAAVTITSPGILDLNNHTDTIPSITMTGGGVTTGTGTLTVSSATPITTSASATGATISGHLSLTNASPVLTVADGTANPDLAISAVVTSGGGLTKLGSGTLALSGANPYTGQTTVMAGTLLVNGSQPSSSIALVGTVSALGGTGTTGPIITPTASSSATISPGTSPGTLSVHGNVILSSKTIFRVELGSAGSDQLNVTGSVNLAGAALSPTLTSAASPGDKFTIVNNDGADPVVGTFAGLAQGATLNVDQSGTSVPFTISYTGGDGNDVVLTDLAPVPPPPPPPPPATQLTLTVPATVASGTAFDVTVKALDSTKQTVPTYAGTVHFTSSDSKATLPPDYTFTTADAGVHTFKGLTTLRTAGSQTITATDKATATIKGTAPVTVTLEPVTRLAGDDRIATAIAASKDSFPTTGSAASAVLARADAFPDALAGTPLAVAKHGPLLLTPSTTLDARTKAEIQRAVPTGGTVYLLGGTTAVSDAVKTALTGAGYTVVRYGGADRYATAVMIADQGLGNPANVLEASGQNFPDALAGGAAAAHIGGAILLTNGSSQAGATATYLSSHPSAKRYALGGPAAAADSQATPLVGADRYETSAKIAQQFFTHPTVVGAAFGGKFPDGLAGGAHIGGKQGPLVLVDTSALPSTVQAYLTGENASIASGYVYGGTLVVGDSVLQAVQKAISGA
jgi:fibronectin-binding autotransporter adhesin